MSTFNAEEAKFFGKNHSAETKKCDNYIYTYIQAFYKHNPDYKIKIITYRY
jgi:hypothetical protein